MVAVLGASRFEFIFVHREIAPIGPPIFEWLIAKVFKKKIIYDFDDAIWLTDRSNESRVLSFIKWRQKVGAIIRWSYKVSCGNSYLSTFARQANSNVIVNPTTIDTVGLHNPALYPHADNKKKNIVIGWTGSHSTLKYLEESTPILSQIEKTFSNVEFAVIADREPSMRLERFRFIPWNSESEIQDLMMFDIGIMPLPDDQWSKGKCGFKALQYMSLGIPAVASPVGVNINIIDHGQNGRLIEDKSLRKKMGNHGREKIIRNYSVSSNSGLFLKLFE
jgi:glycosyltransferase involved in cell wall biosynthesis